MIKKAYIIPNLCCQHMKIVHEELEPLFPPSLSSLLLNLFSLDTLIKELNVLTFSSEHLVTLRQ